jgi:flagellar biosynthesis/type III secretory pathway chaperone
MWPQLIDLLQRLEKAYALLYKSAQEKKGALIMLELQKVQQLNEREEKLTATVRQLEQERQKLILQMIKSDETLRADMDLREMLARCPGNWRSSLASRYETLGQQVQKVQELTADNKVLIEAALKAVHYHLNRIGGAAAGPSYGSNGREPGVQGRQALNFEA